MKLLLVIILFLYLAKESLINIYSIDVYPVILSLLLVILFIQLIRFRINKDFMIFILLIFVSMIITTTIMGDINKNFLNMVFIYIIQPAALLSLITGINDEQKKSFSLFSLYLISYSTYVTFLGGIYFYLVHIYQYPDPYDIFPIEYTSAGELVTLRNTNFLGSALMFAGIALIQFLTSKYLYYLNGRLFFNITSYLALICIAFSLSRRAILPIILFYLFLFFMSSRSTKLKFIFGSVILIVSFSIIFPEIFDILALRTMSIFNIVSDTSNISRMISIQSGLKDIIFSPWGVGFGSLSSVGYEVEVARSSNEIRVTESSIVTIVGEIGIFISILISILIYKYINRLSRVSILLFIVPIFAEMIVGLGLLSPVVSFLTILFIVSIYTIDIGKDRS